MAKKIEQQILNALGVKAYLVRQAGKYRVQPDAFEHADFAHWDASRPHDGLDSPVEAALAFADRLGRFELERQAVA